MKSKRNDCLKRFMKTSCKYTRENELHKEVRQEVYEEEKNYCNNLFE
ncbi:MULTISPECIES: hypothetical protein [Bacteroides]|jgi:hypothetical protein|nr:MULTISPECIES: hypothetical protein [Bacteroides]MCS2520387.1 hypothetical protein [Bacteroides thetaiotaomicron]